MLNLRMKDIRDRAVRSTPVQVKPEALTVLTQVREHAEVGDLPQSILAHGQLTPGIAVMLSRREALKYLEELNDIFGSRHTSKDLVSVKLDGEVCYMILIAGHRRLRTCREINAKVEAGELRYSKKYRGLYRADLRSGLSIKEAIALQFNENRHEQVPPHEEAHAAWGYWSWLRRHNESITIAKFARMIGRSPDWVRKALRFCELPASVQDYVDGKNNRPKLPYGILVELARLADVYEKVMGEKLSEEAHHQWLRRAFLGRLNTTTFGKMVTNYLEDKRLEVRGQLSLFGSSEDVVDTRPVRRVVAPHLVRDVLKIIEYFRILIRLESTGQLGHKDESFLDPERSPAVRELYSEGSPLRLMARCGGLMGDLSPRLVEIARREGGRYRQAILAGESDIAIATDLLSALSRYEGQLTGDRLMH